MCCGAPPGMKDSSENSRDIFIRGGEVPFMNYYWRTGLGGSGPAFLHRISHIPSDYVVLGLDRGIGHRVMPRTNRLKTKEIGPF
jgi:hypothetical protein